jgi:hypothetical protein
LKLLHEHVFKDAHHVYVGTEAVEVPGADAASFVKVAGLGEGKAALFRDRSRHFVYDPTFNEVWSLEQKAGTIVISKPVWLWTKEARRPVRGATVSARLTGEQLSEPEIVLDPAVKASRPPNGEKGKLIDMKSLLIEARKLMGN